MPRYRQRASRSAPVGGSVPARRQLSACLLFALVLVTGLAASASQGLGASGSRTPGAGAALAQVPGESVGAGAAYDLARDEALGGHTLARHVGRTDAQLAERLRREPQISAASTYADQATASRVVALALHASRDRVEGWSRRQGRRPNLVLNYISRDGPPIGRSMRRGSGVASPCDRAIVVLRWHDRMRRWYVLTSYPETRR